MSVKQVFNTSAELDYPTVLPTLDLDFANSKTLDPRITFTRASGGSYVGADGLIKLAGVNEARFDHDPVTGESLGLLVEEARSNLIAYSEEFNDASWDKANATVTSNAITAPDGTLSADLVSNTGQVISLISKIAAAVPASSTNDYYATIYAKKGTASYFTFNCYYIGGTNLPEDNVSFNFDTGVVSGVPNPGEYIFQPVGNDWYRCGFRMTRDTQSRTLIIFRMWESGRVVTSGNTYFWGAQLEQGSFPTSYIPTTTATRTRAADNASITGKNFSEWYRQDEGSVFVNYKGKSQEETSYERIYSINLNSTAVVEEILLVNNIGYNPDRIGYLVYDNSVNIQDTTGTTGGYVVASSNPVKTAMCYKTANYAYVFNGGTVITENAAGVPTVNTLDIGRVGASGQLNGTISRLTYYPKRLTNEQLQALTK